MWRAALLVKLETLANTIFRKRWQYPPLQRATSARNFIGNVEIFLLHMENPSHTYLARASLESLLFT